MRKENTLAFYKFDNVQEKTQPTRLLNMPVMRSIEQSKPSRDEESHDYSRDEKRSSQRCRKIDDRFSRQHYYADLEKEWRQEFNFVEKNHQKSTATCLSLVADLMNHEPSSSKDTSASQEPKTKLLLPLSQETRGKIKTSTLKSMLMNLLCVKTESKIQMTWPWFLRTTMWKKIIFRLFNYHLPIKRP